MDFKAYISAIFYLNESLIYLRDNQKTTVSNFIIGLTDQAFIETKYLCFKFYSELKREFPELQFYYRAKYALTKKVSKFSFTWEIPPQEELERHFNEEFLLFGGIVKTNTSIYANPEDGGQVVMTIELSGCKNCNNQDLQTLIEIIQSKKPRNLMAA